jgi:alkylated DNA repair dioxygenase AlkB
MQFVLFNGAGYEQKLPDGFRYRKAIVSVSEQEALVARIQKLPLREFEFHGYFGKRRVISFGWQYEFTGGGALRKADDIPEFLLPLRALAGSFAGLDPEALEHVLVTEYDRGAGIGWHRDKAVFGDVVGISLLVPCVLRFRRRVGRKARAERKSAGHWERVNVETEPRSAYLLSGPARSEWEHSILRVDALRYSITFRQLVKNELGRVT